MKIIGNLFFTELKNFHKFLSFVSTLSLFCDTKLRHRELFVILLSVILLQSSSSADNSPAVRIRETLDVNVALYSSLPHCFSHVTFIHKRKVKNNNNTNMGGKSSLSKKHKFQGKEKVKTLVSRKPN